MNALPTIKPYRLCGCVYAATEAQAVVLQDIIRDVLGGSGFAIELVETQGDTTTTTTVRA